MSLEDKELTRGQTLQIDDTLYMHSELRQLQLKGHKFTPWENGFLLNTQGQVDAGKTLSEKQGKVIETLYDRHIGYTEQDDDDIPF